MMTCYTEAMEQLTLEAAPLEGITDSLWRNTQSRFFPKADRYYTPFLSPTQHHSFTKKELREILPEYNAGLNVIPQLLGREPEDLLWAISELKAMGYSEVNLNLGCPSGTVVSKKKGSGLLSDLSFLRNFLDAIYARAELPVSIKTRIGIFDGSEWPDLIHLFSEFPVSLLIIHPRYQKQYYKGIADRDAWAYALENTPLSLSYNGDLFRADAVQCFMSAFPKTQSVMLGRGLIANPCLIGMIRGSQMLDLSALIEFHNCLYQTLKQNYVSESAVLPHMKELWFYMQHCFEDSVKYYKKITKSSHFIDYETSVALLFSNCRLAEQPGYCPF